MILNLLDIEIRDRFILQLLIINDLDEGVAFLNFGHEHLNLSLARGALDQEALVHVPVVSHEVFIHVASINRICIVIRLLKVEVKRRSYHSSHLWKEFQNCAGLFHFNDELVVVSTILLPIHLPDVKSLDVVELDLSNIWDVDYMRSLLLLALKLLSPLGKGLILPFELFVSSFLVIMQDVIHNAEFNLNFIEFNIIIINLSVLLFQVKYILTK